MTITAGPPGVVYRARKFARRHRIGISVAASVVFGLLVAGTLLAYGLVQANRQRMEARLARDESQAVSDFLSEMLSSVRPGEEGREVTVKQVLDRAALDLEEQFQDQPLLEAKLRTTIGAAYRDLGEYEPAVGLAEQSLGEEDRLTRSMSGALGIVYQKLGRFEEAERIHRNNLRLDMERFGPRHPESISSRNNLASLYRETGRLDEAVPYYEESVRDAEAVYGPEHPEYVRLLGNLALLYSDLGR